MILKIKGTQFLKIMYGSLCALFIACNSASKPTHLDTTDRYSHLRKQLSDTIHKYEGKIGLALIDLQNGDSLTVNNTLAYAMQSTYKLPLGIAVLQKVEAKQLSLNTKVILEKQELSAYSWSPLKRQNSGTPLVLTVDSLLLYMLSYSDNLACDKLFEVLGGTSYVDSVMHQLRFHDMHIRYTEKEVGEKESRMYQNVCSPFTMTRLLQELHQEKLINKNNSKYILSMLTNDSTSHLRIWGQMPAGCKNCA